MRVENCSRALCRYAYTVSSISARGISISGVAGVARLGPALFADLTHVSVVRFQLCVQTIVARGATEVA